MMIFWLNASIVLKMRVSEESKTSF